jgi:hypothetical protein
MRTYRYLVRAKVALVVDTQPGKNTRLAVCVCNPIDEYSRPAARFILDAMLDQTRETLRALNLRRNVFSLSYDGNTPVRDVLKPLMESLEPSLQRRIESFENSDKPLTWKNRATAIINNVSLYARARLVRKRPVEAAAE